MVSSLLFLSKLFAPLGLDIGHQLSIEIAGSIQCTENMDFFESRTHEIELYWTWKEP